MRGVSVTIRPFGDGITRTMKSVGPVPFGYAGTAGLEASSGAVAPRAMSSFGFARRLDLVRRFLPFAFRFVLPH